jgi:hypothetical protein
MTFGIAETMVKIEKLPASVASAEIVGSDRCMTVYPHYLDQTKPSRGLLCTKKHVGG